MASAKTMKINCPQKFLALRYVPAGLLMIYHVITATEPAISYYLVLDWLKYRLSSVPL